MENMNDYKVNPENNVPQKIYGIMTPTEENENFIPENNIPREIYGVFRPSDADNYNMNPEENVAQLIYGVPNWDGWKELENQENAIKEDRCIDFYIKDKDNNKSICLSIMEENGECKLGFYDGILEEYYDIKSILKSIPKETFEDILYKLQNESEKMEYMYKGDLTIEWDLHIKTETTKLVLGRGAYPENWNKIIEIVSEMEILYKKLSENSEENKDYLATMQIEYSDGKFLKTKTLIENLEVNNKKTLYDNINVELITRNAIIFKISNFIGRDTEDERIKVINSKSDDIMNMSLANDYIITLKKGESVYLNSIKSPGESYMFKLVDIVEKDDRHFE